MKSNKYNSGVNSCEGLKGFSVTFSIFSLIEKSQKTIHTIHNPSQNDQKESVLESKKPILGDCENCKAAGFWDMEPYTGKRLCFHRPYYLGKSQKDYLPCDQARRKCPLRERG